MNALESTLRGGFSSKNNVDEDSDVILGGPKIPNVRRNETFVIRVTILQYL